jgi:ParB family chromosome partitioning protein
MSKKFMSPAERARLAIQSPFSSNELESDKPRKDKPFASAKTGPGGLSAAMMEVDERVIELTTKVNAAEKKLTAWDGAVPTRLIEPSKITHSIYANRLNDSRSGSDFENFKKEISDAGGNVQPIKVRPIPGGGDEYEVVFGHRRHRACLELGLQVLAVVVELDDRKLFEEMDRENRLRVDLRPYEQGLMYKRSLDNGLFPSHRKLAESIGADQRNVDKAVALASLPSEVLCAFSSPLALQYRWASPLNAAYKNDSQAVVALAKDFAAAEKRASDEDVFLALSGRARSPVPQEVVIKGSNGAVAKHKQTSKTHVFEIECASLTPDKVEQIKALITKLIG